jgi:hypothetical protein
MLNNLGRKRGEGKTADDSARSGVGRVIRYDLLPLLTSAAQQPPGRLPQNIVDIPEYMLYVDSALSAVYDYDRLENRVMSGDPKSDACRSLPLRRTPMCHDAVRRCFDRENHLNLFFKDPIVQIQIGVTEREKSQFQGKQSKLQLFVI